MNLDSTWNVAGLTLSGLTSEPAGEVAGTIVALHGGGYSARYWDHPLDPGGSLLRLGASLGYRVIALDRPGYGASHGLTGDAVRIARQAEVIASLVRELASGGGPIFVIGHSMGAILTLHVAARAPEAIAAVEISGLPFEYEQLPLDPATVAELDFLPAMTPEFARALFYGPDGTFDPAILAADRALALPTPAAEITDALECPVATPQVAPLVRVPIQITRAEFENSSSGGVAGLVRCAGLFTASPRVVSHVQVASGHNISLHKAARPYHLRALAFFDEVRATAQV